jgi:hypothetical protein
MAQREHLGIRASLRDVPKVAEQIGQLSAAWSALEFRLFALFALFSGAPLPLARAMFYSQRTTRARLDILLAIAPLILRRRRGQGATPELKKLKKLLGGIGQIAGKRNAYVHDPWGGYSETDKRAFQLRLGGKEVHGRYAPVNRREIARLTDKIETKRLSLLRLYRSLAVKMPALHERLGKPQSLTLVHAMKDIHPKKTKAKQRRQRRSSPR